MGAPCPQPAYTRPRACPEPPEPEQLAALLLWRKWLYDLDNRAAQETGYLFEPILAHAIGGVPVSASKSPVKRRSDQRKGRQVDCLLGENKRAYEFKLRVTIAASGQGRWSEELEFPRDCRASGFTPVLVVLDRTDNPKLRELAQAFRDAGGEVYISDDAWGHLERQAGPTMSQFIERYVRHPLKDLLDSVSWPLPDFTVRMREHYIDFIVGDETFTTPRRPDAEMATEVDEIPDDVDDE